MTKNRLLTFLTFIFLLLGMAYIPYIPLLLFHIDLDSLSETMKIVYSACCDITFILLVFLLYKKVLIKNFKEYFKNFSSSFEQAFKYYLIGLVIMIISNLIISTLTQATPGNEETVRSLITKYPIYMIFSVSIYAPFIEEIIFRKSIRDFILSFENNKITKYIYCFISGFIFAILHIVGSASAPIDYLYIVPYLALGISFAALYTKTNNIFSSISMHFLHNTMAVILYLIAGVV